MVRSGISLVYLGEFNHEITKMFTAMAEDSMQRSNTQKTTQKKVYHVMVETLQNMNRHSDEISDDKVGNGLFIIGKDVENYYIITANKIAREKMPELKEMIDGLNTASKEELRSMYMQQIKHGKLSSKGGAGLGLIDIARKTGEKYHYQFLPLEDKHFYFFVLKVRIRLTLESFEQLPEE